MPACMASSPNFSSLSLIFIWCIRCLITSFNCVHSNIACCSRMESNASATSVLLSSSSAAYRQNSSTAFLCRFAAFLSASDMSSSFTTTSARPPPLESTAAFINDAHGFGKFQQSVSPVCFFYATWAPRFVGIVPHNKTLPGHSHEMSPDHGSAGISDPYLQLVP